MANYSVAWACSTLLPSAEYEPGCGRALSSFEATSCLERRLVVLLALIFTVEAESPSLLSRRVQFAVGLKCGALTNQEYPTLVDIYPAHSHPWSTYALPMQVPQEVVGKWQFLWAATKVRPTPDAGQLFGCVAALLVACLHG